LSTRPIATLSLAAALLVAGLWTAARIPLEWTPWIELPVVRIAASWPGVERYITAPIEAALQAVVGAASVESLSEEGRVSVSIEVAPETDLATFIAEVNDRLARLHGSLPDRVRPFLTKDVPEALRDEQGFMTLQLVGSLRPEALWRLADRTVAPRLQSLPALAGVVVFGGAEQELRIVLDPNRMDALGLGDVMSAELVLVLSPVAVIPE
jgi:multidrug efflux pump subunit AcrB